MAGADPGPSLATYAQLKESALADLFSEYDEPVVSDYLIQGTRLVEEACGRRLAPFTLTETQRADAIDPDEYAETANLPLSIQGTLGLSYATALGTTNLVRHCWLNHFPPHYPDMWAYSGVSVQTILSYGGPAQNLASTQILDGPDDTGHLWFQLGLFLPVGSRVRTTYSGGYVVATPASLVRANEYMSAALIIRELRPEDVSHSPEELREAAMNILDPAWMRA
jgi:hypothetical protein